METLNAAVSAANRICEEAYPAAPCPTLLKAAVAIAEAANTALKEENALLLEVNTRESYNAAASVRIATFLAILGS